MENKYKKIFDFISSKTPGFIKDKTPDFIKDKVNDFVSKKPLASIVIIILVVLFILWSFTSLGGSESVDDTTPVFTVRNGPLKISISESGTIQAREKIVVKNEVEGQSTIISLIEEGAEVKKGDLLIELDSSSLVDQRVDQEISVQTAEASYIEARENLEVVKNQAQSDQDEAQLAYDFAQQDLKKYNEGEYPNKYKEAESKITLAEEELARAKEELEWSKKLFEESYISQTELQADELSLKQKELDVELAKNDLELLTKYTHQRDLAQLESDVKQAKMALERTVRKAKADIVQAEASLKAKELQYNRQKEKYNKIVTQIQKCKIYAPADGTVIFATTAQLGGRRFGGMGDEPLEEGNTVRERQELIHLPTTSGLNVESSVLEADMDKVKVGQAVQITVSTLPDEVFYGRVASKAMMADAMTSFMNPDLKEYDIVVYIEGNGNIGLLRTGMSCTSEIIVEQHTETLYIPVQAVIRVGGKPTVYVVKGNRTVPREVEIGMDNNIMVRVIDGLKEGEVVSLAPPLEQAAVVENGFEDISDISSIPELTEMKNGTTSDSAKGSSGQVSTQTGGTDSVSDDTQERRSGGGFQTLDGDGDGRVSKDEFPGPDEMFSTLDKDGDGYLSESEMPQRGSRSSSGGDMPSGSGPPSSGQRPDFDSSASGRGQDLGPMSSTGSNFGPPGGN